MRRNFIASEFMNSRVVKMKISIAQFKSELGAVEENFSTAQRLIESAQNSDVIILPELWTTGYYPTPVENFADIDGNRTKNFLCAAAEKFGVNIIGGSVIVDSDGKIFNRSLVANRRGEIVAAYDKAHLFSFAAEDKVFSAGDKISGFDLDGVKCGLAICYDLRFPEFVRKIALSGAEIIFIPAAWSLKRLTPRRILTKARAIENQIFVVFANSSGISEIINPGGEVIAESGRGEEILTAEIDLRERAEIVKSMNLFADRNLNTDFIYQQHSETGRSQVMKKIIAVDGPAGAGKSTVSKICAARLGYTYIDTGAMYRAVGLKVLQSGKSVDEIISDIDIKLDDKARVFLDGREVTKEIRTPEVSRAASDVAKFGVVRKKLTELQREMAARGSVIMDGRDIGTQVLPNADLKIFLTATVEERARRRFEELKLKGVPADFAQVVKEISLRDKQDSEREIAPLAKAEDAILLDSTNLTIEQVVAEILRLAGEG